MIPPRLPDGWENRDDAGDLRRVAAALAYAEAEVYRAREALAVNAPRDDHWEALYAYEEYAVPALHRLHEAQRDRERAAGEYEDLLARWHDQA